MQNLDREIKWFEEELISIIKAELLSQPKSNSKAPILNAEDAYGKWVLQEKLNEQDRLLLVLALLPHISPGLIDRVIQENIKSPGDHPEMGGIRGTQFRGFIPTGETAVFLLGGISIKHRLQARFFIEEESRLWKKQAVKLLPAKENEPTYSGTWEIEPDVLDFLVKGKVSLPIFSLNFPAKPISTDLKWKELILDRRTKEQLQELKTWIEKRDIILNDWGLGRRIKPGYKALFHGAPGTGKTLAASLLGSYTKRPVYRIDLSMVVSKYIGETEKNLSRLFDKAAHKDWILFFDEADALFGKRTSVRDAHDKYANQEVSYLLQRLEEYHGLVILASNLKGNIDGAFIRRFQSIIHFPMPQAKERFELWKSMWPKKLKLEDPKAIEKLAIQHSLTGANILNVIQFASLKAVQEKKKILSFNDLNVSVARELKKEGKLV